MSPSTPRFLPDLHSDHHYPADAPIDSVSAFLARHSIDGGDSKPSTSPGITVSKEGTFLIVRPILKERVETHRLAESAKRVADKALNKCSKWSTQGRSTERGGLSVAAELDLDLDDTGGVSIGGTGRLWSEIFYKIG